MARLSGAVFTGSCGEMFLDGVKEAYVESIEVKVTGQFEDVQCCGTFADGYVYNGYTAEGTVTLNYTGTDLNDGIMEGFQSGEIAEHVIVSKLTNKTTGKSANYSVPNVVFTETTPVQIKKGKLTQTLPFKCGAPVPIK